MNKLLTIIISLSIGFVYADPGDKKVELKVGGAVTEFNPLDGFKLTDKALMNLGVKFLALKGNGAWTIPKSALIRIKHSVGVYRRYDGWITMVLVDILDQQGEEVKIKSVDLQDQDEIAIAGVTFLRLTEADLNSDTVDACAH